MYTCFKSILNKPERGGDHTILQALLSVDMFLIFFVSACGLGANLAAIDNLGQLGESLGTLQVTKAMVGNNFSIRLNDWSCGNCASQ
ncbi:hypothetical protein AHAS_Ahas13G0178500 [Arachis hypogaea]